MSPDGWGVGFSYHRYLDRIVGLKVQIRLLGNFFFFLHIFTKFELSWKRRQMNLKPVGVRNSQWSVHGPQSEPSAELEIYVGFEPLLNQYCYSAIGFTGVLLLFLFYAKSFSKVCFKCITCTHFAVENWI